MICNEWLDILLFKKKPADIAGTTLGEGLKHLVIAGAIIGLLSGILDFVARDQIIAAAEEAGLLLASLTPEPTAFDIVGSTILTPIVMVIGMLVLGVILHVLCLIVGGKGNLTNYIGVLAKIDAAITGTAMLAITVIGIVAALAGVYMVAGQILALLTFVALIWLLVLTVLATQAVQKLSLGRTVIAVIVIPLVIAIIIAIMLAALIVAIIATAFSSTMGGLSTV